MASKEAVGAENVTQAVNPRTCEPGDDRCLARSPARVPSTAAARLRTLEISGDKNERGEAASLIADAVIGFGEAGDGGGAKMKFFPAVGTWN